MSLGIRSAMMKSLDCPLDCGREDGLTAGEDANNSAQFDELLLIPGGRNVRVFFNVLLSRTRHFRVVRSAASGAASNLG